MNPTKLGHLFVEIVSVSLRRTLVYRANLLFQLAVALVGTLASVATLGVVFSQTASLAGWSLGAAMVLLGTFEVVSGVLATLVEPNLTFFETKVRDGRIDDVLLQPVPSFVMASLGTFNPLALSRVALGLGVVVFGAERLDPVPSVAHVGAYASMVCAAAVLGWASRMIVASLAFWAPHLSLGMFFTTCWQLGRYPVDVYRPALRFVFIYVLPIALIASVPARVLARGATPTLLLGVLLATVTALLIAKTTWNAGLRRYTSATS